MRVAVQDFLHNRSALPAEIPLQVNQGKLLYTGIFSQLETSGYRTVVMDFLIQFECFMHCQITVPDKVSHFGRGASVTSSLCAGKGCSTSLLSARA